MTQQHQKSEWAQAQLGSAAPQEQSAKQQEVEIVGTLPEGFVIPKGAKRVTSDGFTVSVDF